MSYRRFDRLVEWFGCFCLGVVSMFWLIYFTGGCVT